MKCFRLLVAALFAVLAYSVPSSAAPLTFDFSGSGGHQAVGAPLVYSMGGVTVTATAWTYGINFQPSSLGKWSNGLGVCNANEIGAATGCVNGHHQVDNKWSKDYILFEFASAFLIDPTSALIITTDGSDLDVSYWTGNFVNPGDRLQNDLYTDLLVRGFGPATSNDGSGSSRTVPLVSGYATALLIGAKTSGDDDAFKIDQVSVETSTPVPEPGSLLLLGSGLVAVGRRMRRRWCA